MLWEARLRGIVFENTVTIGHLALHLHPAEVKFFRQAYHIRFPESSIKPLENYAFGGYSESFLRGFLNVTSLTIIDISPYEGADTIHDLNQPIPESLHGCFDVVIDSGSLEHIFNFPIAIANLMKLLKVGGTIFITTPANGLCGHGFYQFSPELMFRVFTGENGFELRKIVLFEALFPSVELTSHRKAYEVIDPDIVRGRVGLLSKGPVMMMVEAKKIGDVPLFTHFPLQSDYLELWNQQKAQAVQKDAKRMLRSVWRSVPYVLRARVQGYSEKRRFSFSNTEFYRRFEPNGKSPVLDGQLRRSGKYPRIH
jgi:SAM-dependent methyltransferase